MRTPNSAVVVGRLRKLECAVDAFYVLFHCVLADEKALGDGLVGTAFGHERQDLALPVGQALKWVAGRSRTADASSVTCPIRQ